MHGSVSPCVVEQDYHQSQGRLNTGPVVDITMQGILGHETIKTWDKDIFWYFVQIIEY